MFVASARRVWLSTWLATGQRPVCSPPASATDFDPSVLNGQDVVYLCLHGYEGDTTLYGDGFVPMLTSEAISKANLDGAVVYLAGCWGLQAASTAFLRAGAAYVVGDTDSTWTGPLWPRGSNELGREFLRQLRRWQSVPQAFDVAMDNYRLQHGGVREMALLSSVVLLTGGGKA